MGGNLNSILTRISLNQLLESIASKLNNNRRHFWNNDKFEHKLHKPCCTCSYIVTNGCHLTTAIRSWLQRSGKKIGANQTRFGTVSDNLSTHPSGRKTSAACFESPPTRRLVYNFKFYKLDTSYLLQFEHHF